MKEQYKDYMRRCEELAAKASAKGNSPVGSLIVMNTTIVAQAEEAATVKNDVSCHAEMEVIRLARKKMGRDMGGAILITNKEPCVMCSYAIRLHGISTVIFKERSSQLGGFSSSFNLLVSENVPESWGPPVKCIQLE